MYEYYEHIVPTYQITISATGLGGAAPSDGFIDFQTQQDYSTFMPSGDPMNNTAVALSKARANLRWDYLSKAFFLYTIPQQIYGVTATGATEYSAATSFVFNVTFDRPDYIIYPPNPAITTPEAVMQQLCADALSVSISMRWGYFDPAISTTPSGQGVDGVRFNILDVGPLGSSSQIIAATTVVQLS